MVADGDNVSHHLASVRCQAYHLRLLRLSMNRLEVELEKYGRILSFPTALTLSCM